MPLAKAEKNLKWLSARNFAASHVPAWPREAASRASTKRGLEGIKLRRLQSVCSADDLDVRLKLCVRDDRSGCRGHFLDSAAPQLEETRHQLLSVH